LQADGVEISDHQRPPLIHVEVEEVLKKHRLRQAVRHADQTAGNPLRRQLADRLLAELELRSQRDLEGGSALTVGAVPECDRRRLLLVIVHQVPDRVRPATFHCFE
jgi:hypothetical protein